MSQSLIRMLGALALVLLAPSIGFTQQSSPNADSNTRGPGQSPTPARFKVAAYNLENGFDVFDNPYTEDETAKVKPREQWKAIAEAIKRMDADIVAFSELENRQVLQSMVNTFLPDSGYDYIAVDATNDGRGINLGMISRFPIRSVTSYRWRGLEMPGDQRPHRFARDLMHAKIALPPQRPSALTDQAPSTDETSANAAPDNDQAKVGPVLNLFAVHFKSKRDAPGDENATKWRTAEARMVRRIVGNLIEDNPNALALVVGDLNSNPRDPAVQILLNPAPPSPSSPSTSSPSDLSDNPLLTDMHASLPDQKRITFPSDRYPNTIFDYILASPAMQRRYIQGTAGLIREPELTTGSDHRPVFASFRVADSDR